MASVNKVILVGNPDADREVRHFPSGDAVANNRVATTDRYKDKASGEVKEMTERHGVWFLHGSAWDGGFRPGRSAAKATRQIAT